MATETYVNDGGTWKLANEIHVNDGGTWKETNEVYVKDSGSWKLVHQKVFAFTITTTSANLNIKNEAISRTSWDGTTAADIQITIDTGVIIYSTSTGTPALVTDTNWPSGSTITLINNGKIQGKGGQGGLGGSGTLGSSPGAGGSGGNAMQLNIAITINNGSGNIWGGGGGGGGGGGYSSSTENLDAPPTITNWGGGGGGGSSGYLTGAGGEPTGQGPRTSGVTPSNGSEFGGSGGTNKPGVTGTGGAGGDAGSNGSTGSNAIQGTQNGGGGGAAGKAINTNGFSVTWTAGNNSSQVRGAVS